MANGNNGVLSGVRRLTGKFRDLAVDGGLPGVPLGFRLRGATQYGPPKTGTWRPGDMVPDRAGNIWTCTAGGTPGTWTASVITVAPSPDTTGATGAAAITAAVALLPASGGVIRLAPTAQWYIECGQVIINRSGVWIDATGCWINAAGAGDVIRMYDSSNYGTRTVQGGGILGMPVIDGTATTGNSAAVHAGDILQLAVFARPQNFTAGTTSKGVWLDNQNYWTEQCYGRIYAQNCTAHVVLDVASGAADTSTGSFARGDLAVYINQVTASNDGVVLQNGADLYDGAIAIRGNFGGSASALTSAVLRVTGTAPAGHPDAGAYSQIDFCRIDIGVEFDGGGANAPSTIAVGSASNTVGATSYGVMDFGSGLTAASGPASSAVYPFNGLISGDAVLAGVSGYPFNYTWNMPGGIALGNFSGPTSISNGSTISTAGTAVGRVTNSGAVTGIILQQGSFDGQLVWVVNTGTGSVTFAASGTSFVADGTADVVPAGASGLYMWDGADGLWYRTSPSTFLPAGMASMAPLNFQAGTNLTAAAPGAVEFDGTAYYATAQATSRQVVDTEQFQVLASSHTLSANLSAQAIFNATSSGAVTVAGSATYFFECLLDVTGLSGSSHNVAFAFGGAATYNSLMYNALSSPVSGGTAVSVISTSAGSTNLFAAAVTGTALQSVIKGTLRVNGGGSIIPQLLQVTADAAGAVAANSYFRIWPAGGSAVTNVGNWS